MKSREDLSTCQKVFEVLGKLLRQVSEKISETSFKSSHLFFFGNFVQQKGNVKKSNCKEIPVMGDKWVSAMFYVSCVFLQQFLKHLRLLEDHLGKTDAFALERRKRRKHTRHNVAPAKKPKTCLKAELSPEDKFREELQGTDYMGQTDFCKILQFPTVFCENLRLLNAVIPRQLQS